MTKVLNYTQIGYWKSIFDTGHEKAAIAAITKLSQSIEGSLFLATRLQAISNDTVFWETVRSLENNRFLQHFIVRLLDLLDSPKRNVRLAATQVISSSAANLPFLIVPLLKMFGDDELNIVIQLMIRLEHIGMATIHREIDSYYFSPRDESRFFLALCNYGNDVSRGHAIFALASFGIAWAKSLPRLLHDPSVLVRRVAVFSFLWNRSQILDTIKSHLQQDLDPGVRLVFAYLCGKKGDVWCAECLHVLTFDPNPQVRSVALFSLAEGWAADARASEATHRLLSDTDDDVRISAIRALDIVNTSDGALIVGLLNAAAECFYDKSPLVRAEVCGTNFVVDHWEYFERMLFVALDSKDRGVRKNAIGGLLSGLRRYGSDGIAESTLDHLSESKDINDRIFCVKATLIASQFTESLPKRIKRFLKDPNTSVRREFVASISSMASGDWNKYSEVVAAQMEDSDSEVAEMARFVMKMRDEKRDESSVERWRGGLGEA